MTTHIAQQRPATYTAINYTGDTAELQAALDAALPAEASWTYAVTADTDSAIITLTYSGVDMTVTAHHTDWVVWLGTSISAPTLPSVLTDEEAQAQYVIDVQHRAEQQ
jgi:hypothetical protein